MSWRMINALALIAVACFEAAAITDGANISDFLIGNGVMFALTAFMAVLWKIEDL